MENVYGSYEKQIHTIKIHKIRFLRTIKKTISAYFFIFQNYYEKSSIKGFVDHGFLKLISKLEKHYKRTRNYTRWKSYKLFCHLICEIKRFSNGP